MNFSVWKALVLVFPKMCLAVGFKSSVKLVVAKNNSNILDVLSVI
ncbi:MAG: hypothetical protein ACJASF_000811 [Vicingaceae bacterium]|jgi:hypothetical protein